MFIVTTIPTKPLEDVVNVGVSKYSEDRGSYQTLFLILFTVKNLQFYYLLPVPSGIHYILL